MTLLRGGTVDWWCSVCKTDPEDNAGLRANWVAFVQALAGQFYTIAMEDRARE